MASDSVRKAFEYILAELRKIDRRLEIIEREEQEELKEEHLVEAQEQEQLSEMAELEKLEQDIKQSVSPHPLTRITYRDVTKGIIGAFIGIVGHFAFFYGEKIAHDLSLFRASMLIITSIAILILFLYFTGFRQVAQKKRLQYIPLRTLTIFLTAHIVIVFVLFLFGVLSTEMPFIEIYKNVASVSILAVLGAATADLIGGE